LEPAEAARRIRARTIRLELAAALDYWADRRQQVLQPSDVVWDGWPDQRDFNPHTRDASWKRLVDVARAADPNEWRDQVRDALQQRDRERLSRLTASPGISDLPAPTLSVVCRHLDNEHIATALRRAQLKHPDNFVINGQLAWVSQDPAEAVRFFTAARAIRPGDTAIAFLLGECLRGQGKRD